MPAIWSSDLNVGAMHQSKAVEVKPARSSGSNDSDNCLTLYIGNLHVLVTVNQLQEVCQHFGAVEQVKVIKDKSTGTSAGYGFVKFCDKRAADAALRYLQGKMLYGQELRVNWAFQSHQREDTSTHHHVFVGDIGQEVTDTVLFNAFAHLGCTDARVMWDHNTGRSKGYGFVSFRTKEEAEMGIEKMQGQQVCSRRVRCGWAQHKQDDSQPPPEYELIDKQDPSNTNVYVGNIAPEWTEQEIQQHFSAFGKIVEMKLHKKGGYGFLRYERHEDAVAAICSMHAQHLNGRMLKCSWGKNVSSNLFTPAPGALSYMSMAPPMPMSGMMGAGAMMSGGLLAIPAQSPGLVGASQPSPQALMMSNQGLPLPLSPTQIMLMGGQATPSALSPQAMHPGARSAGVLEPYGMFGGMFYSHP